MKVQGQGEAFASHCPAALVAQPTFFRDGAAFRRWLARNHATEAELLVGYWKVGTGKPSLSWSESVDEAICFGWIDGVRRSLGDEAYCIRFTPRRPGSAWSKVNVAKARKAIEEGRMAPAGLAAFEARPAEGPAYAFEQGRVALPAEALAALRADPAAWAYWSHAAPSYRKAAAWWVVSAKRPETRQRRVAALVADSAAGRTVKPLTRPAPRRPR
jgi:uncharacterized protein YdeI (YjbR/CyaY-like superfamily)